MFRHGKPRAFIHDLRLATMLSFVAGIVNIAGVLSIKTLTTNVTGHFAFFAEEFVLENYSSAFSFVLFVLFFLFGAITSNFLIEMAIRRKSAAPHALPMMVEIMLLCLAAVGGLYFSLSFHAIANILLFSMGLQNALVTKVSQATVRTTHLTGLFTDLGIELSQLFFYRAKSELKKLTKSISLRLAIISFFFIGCVLGGFVFRHIDLKVLFVAAVVLLIALLFDKIRKRVDSISRNIDTPAT